MKILGRARKRTIAAVVDILLCVFSVAAAFALRLDGFEWPHDSDWVAYAAAAAIALPIFRAFGLYNAVFRFAGWGALADISRAVALYGVIYASIFTLYAIPGVPRSIGIIQPILLFLFVGASRAATRYFLGDGFHSLLHRIGRRRVLIYGAGNAGRQLAAGLANNQEMQIAGFVDDDPLLIGSVINGLPILSPTRMHELIELGKIDDLLLALPSATRRRRNEIIDSLRQSPVTIRTMPAVSDLAHGRIAVNDLRELEIEDLLGRDAVPPNQLLLSKCIVGKTVLVTGAGGSIGSELCRQILGLKPRRLILLDNSEYNLYAIEQELGLRLAEDPQDTEILAQLASVRDRARIDGILAKTNPDTIYHAAAYKHVPLVEANAAEGVLNNVFGTRNMVQLAEAHGIADFVLISTDKAVRPANVMGATKRLAEMVLQAQAASGTRTRFSMVRFGNVLGSSGSVIPLFRKQIRAGGPVTVTHADITRYFMTIAEAAQLVIQAGAMAKGGEVFVLDMGTPMRIVDLARRMIDLSGLKVRDESNPDGDIEIRIVGLRPGEKLFEELLIGDNPQPTNHPRIMKAHDDFMALGELTQHLEELEMASLTQHEGRIRDLLNLHSAVDENRRDASVVGSA